MGMLRSHFVVLEHKPSAAFLAKLKWGYQLWRESRTGLFYLTQPCKPLGRRPKFHDFLDWNGRADIDVSFLKTHLEKPPNGVNLRRLEVNFDLVEAVAYLSKQLDQPVLAAEDTDDEYAMAVMVADGAVQYLRIRTTYSEPRIEDGIEEWPRVDVTYSREGGFGLDQDPTSEFCGVAQTAIRDLFGIADLNLYNYTDTKPTREQVKARDDPPKSITGYLDSYGVFKRISHAEPQLSWKERAKIAARFVVLLPLYPFIAAGILGSLVFFDKWVDRRLDKDGDLPFWFVIPLGAAILAIPILILVWIARAVFEIAFSGG